MTHEIIHQSVLDQSLSRAEMLAAPILFGGKSMLVKKFSILHGPLAKELVVHIVVGLN